MRKVDMAVEMQDVSCLHTLCPLRCEILSGERVFCILEYLITVVLWMDISTLIRCLQTIYQNARCFSHRNILQRESL